MTGEGVQNWTKQVTSDPVDCGKFRGLTCESSCTSCRTLFHWYLQLSSSYYYHQGSRYRWFSRYVIAAMLVDENKRFLISSFCSSTSNCTLQHCYLCPSRLVANHLFFVLYHLLFCSSITDQVRRGAIEIRQRTLVVNFIFLPNCLV